MPKRTRDYRESLMVDLKDSSEAAEYLNAALEDSDEMFLIALRDVAEALGMSSVAAEAGVAREAMYRMLSGRGNPTYTNLRSILTAIGVRPRLEPIGVSASGAGCETGLFAIVQRKSKHKTKPIRSRRQPAVSKRPSGHRLFGAKIPLANVA
jgi:probable addiction module antidote protein